MWVIIRRSLYAITALALLAVVVIYLWSSLILNRSFTAQERNITLSADKDVIAEGERKAQIFGCYHGCHGADMQGEVFFEQAFVARMIAPNLTQASRKYSPAEMEAIIRQGVRPDGSGVTIMPSRSFTTMTDQDLSAVLSFIHDFPEQTSDFGKSSFGLVARALVIADKISIETAEDGASPWQQTWLDEPLKHGEYLVMNACSECHGLELEGDPGFSPPLVIAKAYNRAQFHTLLKDGKALVDRDLGLMGLVIENRFSRLQSHEIDAIYDFLHSR